MKFEAAFLGASSWYQTLNILKFCLVSVGVISNLPGSFLSQYWWIPMSSSV